MGTRRIVSEPGALGLVAGELAATRGHGAHLWVLSDGNTENAAGERLKSSLARAKIVSRILPASPKVQPAMELVRELDREVRDVRPDLVVSVGSGVLADLAKRVSFDTGVANWAVATAASVDAYTSGTSALRVDGYHGAVPTRPSEIVICDLDVIARAPRRLFLAGLGDLLAKFIAFLDWNLARVMTGEYYCPFTAGSGLAAARAALDAARRHEADPLGAARTLTDAALTSGLAMQALAASRSAASAEHTIAHFWETARCVGAEEHDLHGILVGAASRLVLKGYARFYAGSACGPASPEARFAAFDRGLPWEETVEPGLAPYLGKVREEMQRKPFDRELLAARLAGWDRERESVLAMARPLLAELAQAVRTLESMGYPFAPHELGIPDEMCLLPARNVRLLRSRYSTFDLAWELGTEAEIVEAVVEAIGPRA
jgi:glycerol-1-phosphate dehydrogenase [NAD(P)+]